MYRKLFAFCVIIIFVVGIAQSATVTFFGGAKFGSKAIKNLPVQITIQGANQSDTMHDPIDGQLWFKKIGYSNATGMFSITFHGVQSKHLHSQIEVTPGIGTSMENSSYIDFSLGTDTLVSYSLDADPSYVGILTDNVSIDSIKTFGKITTPDTTSGATGVDGANVKITFIGNYSPADTVSIPGIINTSSDGSFIAPAFCNSGLYNKALISVSKNGYTGVDTVISSKGILWDGNCDTIKARLGMKAGTIVPDTIDTLLVQGTVKDSAGGTALSNATVKISVGKDGVSYPSSKSVLSDNNGNYEAKIPNSGKTAHVYYKAEVSLSTYLSITRSKDTTIAAPADGKNDIIPMNLVMVKDTSLIPGDSIIVRGTVDSAGSSKMLAGAHVAVSIGQDDFTIGSATTTTTDTNGAFKISFLNLGKWGTVAVKVVATATDYISSTLKKDTIIAKPRDGVSDTAAVKVSLMHTDLPGDTIVVRAMIKNSDGTSVMKKALAQIALSMVDTNTANYHVVTKTIDTTDSITGILQYTMANFDKISHIYCQVIASAPDYAITTKRQDTTFLAVQDGKKDTMLMTVNLNRPPSSGDTLIIRGKIIRDSLNNAERPLDSAIVKISLGSAKGVYQVEVSCTTSSAGTYVYKAFNNYGVNKVFARIKVSRNMYSADSALGNASFNPNDYQNDTVTVNCKINPTTKTAYFSSASYLINHEVLNVKVFTLSGKLIGKIVSTRGGYRNDLTSFFKTNRISRNMCIVAITDKNGIVQRKMQINVK